MLVMQPFLPNESKGFHDMFTMRGVWNRAMDVCEDGYGDTSPYDVVSKKVGGAGDDERGGGTRNLDSQTR